MHSMWWLVKPSFLAFPSLKIKRIMWKAQKRRHKNDLQKPGYWVKAQDGKGTTLSSKSCGATEVTGAKVPVGTVAAKTTAYEETAEGLRQESCNAELIDSM